jgi:hypothetical protein
MLKKTSHWLRRISTTWVALSGLAIFLLFSALVLPAQSATSEAYSEGVGSPDTSLLYSRDDLYDTAEAYGEEGRAAYVRARFTFDVIWPLVYAFFLTTAISWVFSRAFAAHSRWQWANLAPLLAALLDTLENVSASVVMLRYPDRTAVLDTLAPAFTLLKWIFVGGSFGLLFAGIVVGIGRWVARRGRRSR